MFGQPNLRFRVCAGDTGRCKCCSRMIECASSEREAFDDNALRVVERGAFCGCAARHSGYVVGSGAVSAHRLDRARFGWGGGEDRFNRPGFEEHLRGWEGWLAVKQVRRRARRPRQDDRLLGLVIGRRVSRPVELLHGVGGLVVGQWQDVR